MGNIYPLSAILNLRRTVRISGNIQHMMMFSGLRGAIAFALAIRNTISESRQMILSTTLLIVIVTVIVNGGSTLSVLNWLGVPIGVSEDQTESDPIVNSPLHGGYQSVEEGGGGGGGENGSVGSSQQQNQRPEKSWLALQWAGIDNKLFKPLLTHSNPTLMDTLPNRCLPIGRIFTSREQLMKHPMMQDKEGTSSGELDSAAFTAV